MNNSIFVHHAAKLWAFVQLLRVAEVGGAGLERSVDPRRPFNPHREDCKRRGLIYVECTGRCACFSGLIRRPKLFHNKTMVTDMTTIRMIPAAVLLTAALLTIGCADTSEVRRLKEQAAEDHTAAEALRKEAEKLQQDAQTDRAAAGEDRDASKQELADAKSAQEQAATDLEAAKSASDAAAKSEQAAAAALKKAEAARAAAAAERAKLNEDVAAAQRTATGAAAAQQAAKQATAAAEVKTAAAAKKMEAAVAAQARADKTLAQAKADLAAADKARRRDGRADGCFGRAPGRGQTATRRR